MSPHLTPAQLSGTGSRAGALVFPRWDQRQRKPSHLRSNLVERSLACFIMTPRAPLPPALGHLPKMGPWGQSPQMCGVHRRLWSQEPPTLLLVHTLPPAAHQRYIKVPCSLHPQGFCSRWADLHWSSGHFPQDLGYSSPMTSVLWYVYKTYCLSVVFHLFLIIGQQ